MRAIIIEDKDCQALLDQLKLQQLSGDIGIFRKDPNTPVTLGEVHKAFHYIVVNWLQAQGFK